MLVAITRRISPAIGKCELTHIAREAIDVERADRQHRQYEMQLVNAGCDIVRLPADPLLPDSVFVEDTAVVLNEIAIIARPGAETRRDEIRSVAGALSTYRPLAYIEPPATLDGGDVLEVGQKLYVGEGHRSNAEGVAQLRRIVSAHGYEVIAVPFSACLHLKSAVSRVAQDTLLVNPRWVDKSLFGDHECVDIDPSEPAAANGLQISNRVIFPLSYPRTAKILADRGIDVQPVDVSEISKAEGGVTCCSLVLRRKD